MPNYLPPFSPHLYLDYPFIFSCFLPPLWGLVSSPNVHHWPEPGLCVSLATLLPMVYVGCVRPCMRLQSQATPKPKKASSSYAMFLVNPFMVVDHRPALCVKGLGSREFPSRGLLAAFRIYHVFFHDCSAFHCAVCRGYSLFSCQVTPIYSLPNSCLPNCHIRVDACVRQSLTSHQSALPGTASSSSQVRVQSEPNSANRWY